MFIKKGGKGGAFTIQDTINVSDSSIFWFNNCCCRLMSKREAHNIFLKPPFLHHPPPYEKQLI